MKPDAVCPRPVSFRLLPNVQVVGLPVSVCSGRLLSVPNVPVSNVF